VNAAPPQPAASGQGEVDRDTFFNFAPFLPHRGAFISEIGNFFNVNNGHINPVCPAIAGVGACNCPLNAWMRAALFTPGNEEGVLGFFNAILSVPPPLGTLNTTWRNFGAISRICQGVFSGKSEPAVDQAMTNLCRVAGTLTAPVTAANSQHSWNAIRTEIVNNQRMVIVTFENPANPEEAHSCVAFRADNAGGGERLFLYNPWGNVIPVRGNDPGTTHNLANGFGGGVAVNWNICQYTTFDY
jgi:hypothetical protein